MKAAPLTFCTVITQDHFLYAAALHHSLKARNPDSRFVALVTDAGEREEARIREMAEFEILLLSDLDIAGLKDMRTKYDAFELCNAVRPSLLKHLLLRLNCPTAIYVDADIFVVGSFDDLDRALDTNHFCLTPHITTPYPRDGMLPDDFSVLSYGEYNSGFFAVRNSGEAIQVLDFLIDRLRSYCYRDPPYMFVDQKWFSLLTCLYRSYFGQIDHPGYNVAYWNLHERHIEHADEEFYVNGGPAVFFHMSGFDRKNPTVFTKRGVKRDKGKPRVVTRSGHRYTVDNYPVLRLVVEKYSDLLRQMEIALPADQIT
ncbi:MAG: hypothetical protein P8R42_08495 [Candidatus Binatia bacterium]|nr:hypothetical protein [Candidatus Binatia bacterium]